jgi:rhamnosyltransferase
MRCQRRLLCAGWFQCLVFQQEKSVATHWTTKFRLGILFVTDVRSVGIVMLTYNAAKLLPTSLPPLLAMSPRCRVLVVDSSSNDGTAEIAAASGAEVMEIPQREFNHGTTREMARHAIGTDIVVMMTHDAIAVGTDMIRNLVAPIVNGDAAVSYARQLAHDGADFFESFPREFNYPAYSELRSSNDIKNLGPRTFFCSDSCCAWLNSALDSIGGFQRTLTAEDVEAAAKLIHAGFKIAYQADALVKHSHQYRLWEEFCRHFDTGYFRALQKDLIFASGGDSRRGTAFIFAMLSRLWRKSPKKIPYAIATIAAKFAGYHIGYHGRMLPTKLKEHLSSQPYYWR